jgi:hypothetical protein
MTQLSNEAQASQKKREAFRRDLTEALTGPVPARFRLSPAKAARLMEQDRERQRAEQVQGGPRTARIVVPRKPSAEPSSPKPPASATDS